MESKETPPPNLDKQIRNLFSDVPQGDFAFARLDQPLSLDRYISWIDNHYQGEMDYLRRHLEAKRNPTHYFSPFVSAIVFREHYFLNRQKPDKLQRLKIALYAQSFDYHERLKGKFKPRLEKLGAAFPKESFGFFTDSAPILERDLAHRAGLGWFGKNSMLIDEKTGSFFFIAQILTTLPLVESGLTVPDRCGTCNRCVEACPTNAILPDRQIDARRCISYLNIESKEIPKPELRGRIEDWFFGCDVCQLVCPWNEKVFGKGELQVLLQKTKAPDTQLIDELRWILSAPDADLKQHFKDWPMARSKPFGLRRNALLVVGNLGLAELTEDARSFTKDPRLKDLALWALERLANPA